MSESLRDPQTLPLQAFTTAAALLELVDKRVVVYLRDGQTLYGALRSFDPYGNIVLQRTVERIYLDNNRYAERERGLFILRGENLSMIGELDLDRECPNGTSIAELQQIDFAEAEQEFVALKKAAALKA